ncbi:MAG: AAA family ATPase [Candidatus Omnitrophica bacterium]|nr:AAA family ATPase [Candidatus Omnitrophota bacterium]
MDKLMYRRFKMHFLNYRLRIFITLGFVLLVGLSVYGMMSLESYYRNITLAQMPVSILMVIINSVVFVYMYSMVLGGGFSKVDKKGVKGSQVNVHFADIVGIDEAKEECWEVVNLIRDHARVQKIGGKILRGILMVGPPGCGKTYLAKGIATESGLPFLAMAASEFNEVFVGVGASRVRKLFAQARSLSYGYGGCIIFIDELDALGHKRTFNQFGGAESNNTQNQILVEMDGLNNKGDNIIVIGATNASEDILDPALLRPGRFDRKVYITKPGLEGREALFRFYLSKVKYEASIDPKRLARKAVGKSPADIENVIKEAALIATRNGKDTISTKEISEAIERIDLGMRNKITMNERERMMTSYHETGHLIATFLLHPRDDVFKASIVPRRGTLGVVYPTAIEEWHSQDRETLFADIKVCLAGYAAEKVKFGTTTNGVSSDFKKAMVIAHHMVWQCGMGPSGYIGDYSSLPPEQLSDEVKARLNEDTNKIVRDCLKEVETLLRKETQIFERFAQELLEKQELDYDQIETIFAEYGKVNPRMFSPDAFKTTGEISEKPSLEP